MTNPIDKLNSEDLPYLERVDELDHLRIVRLKGAMDQNVVPLLSERIAKNREREGIVIDKNVLIDYKLVTHVDTAAIAFHLVRLKEYEAAGRSIGFINVSDQLKNLLDMFKQTNTFKIYSSEEEAVAECNI